MIERVYGLLLYLLPPGIRRRDGEAIRWTFSDLLAEPGAPRASIVTRAFLRLPGVIALEWLELLGLKSRGRPRGRRRFEHGWDGMGNWIRSFRQALRSLLKTPSFTFSTALLIALGVGAVTAVFTIVDAVVIRSLPYPAADRLVYMTNGSHNGATLDRLDDVEAFELWAPTSGDDVNLSRDGGSPLRLRTVETTPAFFTMFGARPALGRLLVDADASNHGLAVLTHQAWTSIWASDPNVVGSTMRIDGGPVEIVGVLDASFVPPETVVGQNVHYFRPMNWENEGLQQPGYHAHSVSAQLRPGITIEAADQQIDAVERAVAEAFPDYYSDWDPADINWPLVSMHERTVSDVKAGLMMMLAAVGLLLLVACANVAHLFMARGISRAREMSIRKAIGARTRNLVGQLATESLVIGLIGGLGGLLIAYLTLNGFESMLGELPRGADITVDLRILAFAALISTTTALMFGMIPALRTLGSDVQSGLRGSGRGVSGGRGIKAFRSGLVVAEVAMSLVLVASAGLLMRSFLAVTSQDPGLDPENVWAAVLNVPGVESPQDYTVRMDAVDQALRSIPGVQHAGYAMEIPFQFVGGNGCCWTSGETPPNEETENPVRVRIHAQSSEMFDVFGTEIIAGAAWTELNKNAAPRPIVVTEALAIRFYGSAEAAIGEPWDLGDGAIIAGVAEPTLHYGLDQDHSYAIYIPIEALPFSLPMASVAVRLDRESSDIGRAMREAVWSVEPDLPVPSVQSMEARIDESSAARRFGSVLFITFGVLALTLAAAGLYGTLLYTVGQRRKELGIRLALGAGRNAIQTDVVRRGFIHAAIGVAIGGVAAWYVGRLLDAFVFGISPTDPVALVGSALVLLATALVASWIPAHRAGRTDPLETLKAE